MAELHQLPPPRDPPPQHVVLGCSCLLLALAASALLCSCALLAWALGLGGSVSPQLYLLPDDGACLLAQLALDLSKPSGACSWWVLPPCGRLGQSLEDVRRRLPAGSAQALVEGCTAQAHGRHDVAWMERRRLPKGTIHAKALVVDDVLWWGSWNWSLTALGQADMVQRVEGDQQQLQRVLRWIAELRKLSRPVRPGEAPAAAFKGQQVLRDMGAGYDPDLGRSLRATRARWRSPHDHQLTTPTSWAFT